MAPPTRYAKSGDFNIAYQVFGEGAVDLVLVPGLISHLEMHWADPATTAAFRRLASFARLIVFDKRGTGLSDPVTQLPTLEERMDDLRAVLDAAGAERPALFGWSEGGPTSLLFAATYPERVRGLILHGAFAKGAADPDEPGGLRPDHYEVLLDAVDHWGEGKTLTRVSPSHIGEERLEQMSGVFERLAASTAMARAVVEAVEEIDVTDILPAIRVPTLVLHRTGDFIPISAGRYIAEHVPGARFVELPGEDHHPWLGDPERLIGEIEEFLTGARRASKLDRILATVLFTDIVGSTERAAQEGDAAWAT